LAGVILAAGALLAVVPHAQAGWSVGIGLNFPVYGRPYYHGPRVYRPYPVYVQPAPLLVQPVPVYQPVYPAYSVPAAPVAPAPVPELAPAPAPVPAPAPAPAPLPTVSYTPSSREADVDRYLQKLQNPDPRERTEAAVQLGRLRATRAVPQLSATLSNDRSPAVRDGAARALGLIGSTDALAALQRAAQSDDDRDVRRSASYAAEVIRAAFSR
jgi:HEAT repeats